MKRNVVMHVEEAVCFNEWYKCKRCKAEFKLERLYTNYYKIVNFCPYCGIQATKQPKHKEEECEEVCLDDERYCNSFL